MSITKRKPTELHNDFGDRAIKEVILEGGDEEQCEYAWITILTWDGSRYYRCIFRGETTTSVKAHYEKRGWTDKYCEEYGDATWKARSVFGPWT